MQRMGCQKGDRNGRLAKAFDTVRHEALWKARAIFEVKGLYAEQRATVLTDKESDMFETQRWTKQGDP